MYNKITLIGNLTKDGETRFLTNGSEVYKNSIATSHKYKKQDGSVAEEICYLEFSCFGSIANICSKYLKKGSKVLLDGRLVFEQWTDNNGQNRSKHSLKVEEMKMLDSKKSSDENAPTQNYQNQSNQELPTIDIDDDEIPF